MGNPKMGDFRIELTKKYEFAFFIVSKK